LAGGALWATRSSITAIGISGSYGGLNRGDEAILTSMVASLRAKLPDVRLTVFSRDAAHTRSHHELDAVVGGRSASREELVRHVEGLDLLLLGGGGLLFDGEARHFLREVRLAQRLGIPTMAYAVGAGPLSYAEDQRLVRESLCEMRAVTVRDAGAKRVLEHLDLDCPVEVTADPALLLVPEPLERERLQAEGIPGDRPLVGMSLREPGLAAPDLDVGGCLAVLSHAGDFVADRYDCDVVFIPMETGDIRLSHAVIAGMTRAEHAHVLHGEYRPAELLGLMAHLDLVVAMRLHVLIFAAVTGTPLFPLPYAAKVADFLDAIDVPQPPAVARDSVGSLLAAVDRAWDLGHRQPGHGLLLVDGLRERSRRTLDIALGCLDDRAHDPLAVG
jgi:polysaccharide pyruvyl transferase CsaB